MCNVLEQRTGTLEGRVSLISTFNLSSTGLLVEAFDIPALTHLQGSVDEHLKERQPRLYMDLFGFLPVLCTRERDWGSKNQHVCHLDFTSITKRGSQNQIPTEVNAIRHSIAAIQARARINHNG